MSTQLAHENMRYCTIDGNVRHHYSGRGDTHCICKSDLQGVLAVHGNFTSMFVSGSHLVWFDDIHASF